MANEVSQTIYIPTRGNSYQQQVQNYNLYFMHSRVPAFQKTAESISMTKLTPVAPIAFPPPETIYPPLSAITPRSLPPS